MDIALLGLAAGTLTTAAWLPQLHRTWRRRSADDLSWPYLATFGAGIVAWIAYGVVDGDVALLAANVVTLVLLVGLVALKFWTRHPLPSKESGGRMSTTSVLKARHADGDQP